MESLQNDKDSAEPIVVHNYPVFADSKEREQILEDILHRVISIYHDMLISEHPENRDA